MDHDHGRHWIIEFECDGPIRFGVPISNLRLLLPEEEPVGWEELVFVD